MARRAGELRQLEPQFPSLSKMGVKGFFDLLFERLSGDRD